MDLIQVLKFHEKSILTMIKVSETDFVSSSRDMTLKKWSIEGHII